MVIGLSSVQGERVWAIGLYFFVEFLDVRIEPFICILTSLQYASVIENFLLVSDHASDGSVYVCLCR